MKKLFLCLFAAFALTVSAWAVGAEPSTPICFGTSAAVCGIDAEYQVKTEGVAAIDVAFVPEIGFAFANYKNGKLIVSIASPSPLDLTHAVAQVTATLSDSRKAAPELELISLWFDGLKAKENLYVSSVDVRSDDEVKKLFISAHSDFLGKSYPVLIAAYRENGQMASVHIEDMVFDTQGERVEILLPDDPTISTITAFFVTEAYRPITRITAVTIEQR